MKRPITSVLLFAILTMLVGCVSPPKGPAYAHQQEFRQQLSATVPVKEYGYTIGDLRFSEDYQKALVVFTHADRKTMPNWEFVLASDGFGRYQGMGVQPFYTLGTASRPQVSITVVLPKK